MSESAQTVRFTLRLWGEALTPLTITEIMGVQPDDAFERDFRKPLKYGRFSAPRSLGMWSIGHTVEVNFESELKEFVKAYCRQNLLDIEGVEKVVLDVYFGLTDLDATLDQSYECLIPHEVSQILSLAKVSTRITIS